jgi:cell division initiation protein
MKTDKLVGEVLGKELVLTPSEIVNKEFKRSVRGYNPREVVEFLGRVADLLEDLVSQVRALKEKDEQQKTQLDQYREIENTLRDALASSQRFSEDVLDTAKREAHALIEEARLAKAQAEFKAARLPIVLAREVRLLRQERNRLRAELKSILQTHMNLVESLIPEEAEGTQEVFDLAPETEAAASVVQKAPAVEETSVGTQSDGEGIASEETDIEVASDSRESQAESSVESETI